MLDIEILSHVIIQLQMSHLELFSKSKRKTHSLITEPALGLQKQHSYQNKFSPLLNSRPQNASREGYAKALPKNIPYDKQSLYFEVLSLKRELNQLMDDNIRLKTKNIALEQELDTLSKKNSEEKRSVLRSRIGKNEGVRPSENPFVDGLKQMLKESKKQAEVLKSQNMKMKKSVKLSKINELEVENETILQENLRLSQLNEDFQKRMDHARLLQDKNQQLERNRMSLIADVKRLEQQVKTLQSYIQAIQLEHKYNSPSKNRLWQPSIPRRGNSGMKNLEQLRRQFLNNREAAFRINRKDPKSKFNQGLLLRKDPIIVTHLLQGLKEPNQIQHLEEENKKLKKDKEILENTIKKLEIKQEKSIIKQEKPQGTGRTLQKQKEQSPSQEKLSEEKEKSNRHEKTINQEKEDKYEKQEKQWQQGEKSQEIKLQYNSVQGLLQSGATPPKVVQEHSKAFSQPEAQFGQRSVFKFNKRIIDEICQILSSRMRAQRYAFSELQADIEKSAAKEFSYVDLCHMLVNQPFYLTVDYCRVLLCFILEKDRPSHADYVPSMTLIAKLRKVIKDSLLPSEEEENLMVQHCAEIITNYSKEVRGACQQARGNEGRLSANHLKQILQKYGLNHNQIDMVIGELAICSPSLANLDLQVLFQRFDLQEVSDNVIQQQENDDSFIHMSKNREQIVSKKGSGELFSSKKARVKSKIQQQLKV